MQVEAWEQFVFVNLDPKASRRWPISWAGWCSGSRRSNLARCTSSSAAAIRLNCNWKVFVDNYLDGGYHVPHLHKALNSVLDYKQYTIENEDRYCLQSSPMVASDVDAATSATRTGERAWYFWQYPNFMINLYAGLHGHQPGVARRSRSLQGHLRFLLRRRERGRGRAQSPEYRGRRAGE